MFGNIKSITLADGRVIDFESRAGEFFEVPEGDFIHMVHQTQFFKELGQPELLDLLLEKEESYKRSEAGKKAAETRKRNKAKKKAEKIEQKAEKVPDEIMDKVPEDIKKVAEASDNVHIVTPTPDTPAQEPEKEDVSGEGDMSAELEDIADALEQTNDSAEDIDFEEVEALQEVEEEAELQEAEEAKEVTPEEAFGDDKKEELIDEVAEAQNTEQNDELEVAIEWNNPKAQVAFELFQKAGVNGTLLFGGDALFMLNNTDGFAQKMAAVTEANTDELFQIGTTPNEALVYKELKYKELKKTKFDLIVASPPMNILWSTATELVNALKDDAQLFVLYPTVKAKKEEPAYSDYTAAVEKLSVELYQNDNKSLSIDVVTNTKL